MHETSSQKTVKALSAGIISTLLLVLVSVSNPLFGIVCSWLIPLPVLFYRTRLGRKISAVIPIVVLLFLIIISKGVSADILLLAGLMFLGFLLSESFEKDFSTDRTILFSCGGVLLTGMFILFFYSTIVNTGFTELITGFVDKNISQTIELYKSMGVLENEFKSTPEMKESLVLIISGILPGLAASMLIFTAWINILVAGAIFDKHNIQFAGYGKLKLWKAPDQLVWVTIISGLSLMIPVDAIKYISLNIILILLLLYFLQGIAITSFYFDKKRYPRGIRIVLYGLIMIQSILLIFIIGIGFFDMWINFRKTGIDKTGTLND